MLSVSLGNLKIVHGTLRVMMTSRSQSSPHNLQPEYTPSTLLYQVSLNTRV